MVWLAIYPSVLVALHFLEPITTDLPLPLRTLVLTAIVVPVAVIVVVPLIQRLLRRWLV